nr:MAG TPA: hypothetical protein [Caudoviricetes sp.]
MQIAALVKKSAELYRVRRRATFVSVRFRAC